MSNAFLVQCEQLLLHEEGTFVASQLTHQPNCDRMFLKHFRPGLFLCGTFFALTNGHELLRFFDDILSSNQQSMHGEHSEQLVDYYTKRKLLTIVLRGNLSRNFLMYFS